MRGGFTGCQWRRCLRGYNLGSGSQRRRRAFHTPAERKQVFLAAPDGRVRRPDGVPDSDPAASRQCCWGLEVLFVLPSIWA